MSDTINETNTTITTSEVIYQREEISTKKQPEFKPGNTPYTQYGNETLNANVLWYQVVNEILAHCTQEQLVAETGLISANMTKIRNQNYRRLNFRTGAKLLAIHCQLYPEQN